MVQIIVLFRSWWLGETPGLLIREHAKHEPGSNPGSGAKNQVKVLRCRREAPPFHGDKARRWTKKCCTVGKRPLGPTINNALVAQWVELTSLMVKDQNAGIKVRPMVRVHPSASEFIRL